MEIGYTITKLDTEAKLLDVSFENGQWARIPLVLPFPSTQEELDAVVREYAPSKEQVLAAQASTATLEFVNSKVGSTTSVTLQTRKLVPDEPVPVEKTLEQKQEEVWNMIKRERSRQNSSGVKVGNHWFHSDAPSRSQYALLDAKAIREGWTNDVVIDNWKVMSPMANPVYVPMTVGLLRQILDAGIMKEKMNFVVAEQHRIAMLASSDPLTYDYSTGWAERYVETV